MDDEIGRLFLYLSGFGFSELFLEFFKIESFFAKFSYYSILLCISVFLLVYIF
jgi:hypothetical protein